MPHARLTVDVPETVWIGELSSRHPELVFEVLTAISGEEVGIALVRLGADDPLPVITEIQDRDDVETVELLWKHEDEALLQIETTNPLPLVPIWRAGVPLRMPFEIQDGQATWEVTTSQGRLSTLQTALDDVGIGFTVEYVQSIGASQADRLLTDRQQEVLVTAVQAGYYRSPREATLGDVAELLGIATATCSDVLHRAEGNVLHWFVDEHVSA